MIEGADSLSCSRIKGPRVLGILRCSRIAGAIVDKNRGLQPKHIAVNIGSMA